MKNVNEIKLAKDPDLFVGMLANDPRHLARAKAKAAKVARANNRAAIKKNHNLDVAAEAFISAARYAAASCLAILSMGALALAFLV